jgi:predicted TIM-barrel fold metal-dependent hydrolase
MNGAQRRIDAHQHAYWHYRDDAALVEDMDLHGIEYAWLLTWEIHPSEHRSEAKYDEFLNPLRVRADGSLVGIPLEDLIAARENYPKRFVLGFCPHPLMGDAAARLRGAASMYDIKVCGEWKFRIPFDDPRCIELFRVAGELGLPVVLHLDVPFLADADGVMRYDPNWYGGTINNLERALIACPKTNFIGHAPGFWREISGNSSASGDVYPQGPIIEGGGLQRLLDRYENLWADLSAGSACMALKRDPAFAKEFLEGYASRLLFARDYYGGSLIEFLDTLDLSDAATQSIAWRNAERLVAPPDTNQATAKRPPLNKF